LARKVEVFIEPGETQSPEPIRVLLVEHDPRAALLGGEMLRAAGIEGLILAHTQRLSATAHELADRGAL
jgi:hypothetical protein